MVVVGRGTLRKACGRCRRGRRRFLRSTAADVAGSGTRRHRRRTDHDGRSRTSTADPFLEAAVAEARAGLDEGGIPIGSVLMLGDRIVGRGRNRRVQEGSVIKHAEMDCLENAGRLPGSAYRRSVLYSTLSPCDMCSGAVLLCGIPRVVIGENRTFRGPEGYVRSRGVAVEVVDDPDCRSLIERFIAGNPALWAEDIGV